MNWKSWFLSLSSLVLAVSPDAADAAVKIGNLSRANKAQAYQQVNETRYQAELANQQAAQAVSQDLAQQVQTGTVNSDVSSEQLNKCSMIYPTGEFMWSKPMAGRGAGGANTCVAVVELRASQAGPNGEDLVVARTNLAAGDSMNCNISDFPEHSWLPEAAKVEFPSDTEPTREDVIAVMNEEQKQHAGLKILAGGLVAAVAGNAMGENDVGKDGIFGTSKSKLKSTAIGALGGAGLMAASSFGGKVGGDMIMSAGVNAAAGALVGNMSGKGDSVLRIEKCTVDGQETTCAYALLSKVGDTVATKAEGSVYVNQEKSGLFLVCTGDGDEVNLKCVPENGLLNPELYDYKYDGDTNCTFEKAADENFENIASEYKFCYLKEKDGVERFKRAYGSSCGETEDSGPWIKLKSANRREHGKPVMLVGVEDKAFGWKIKDFKDALESGVKDYKIVGRNANGAVVELDEFGEYFKGYGTYGEVKKGEEAKQVNFQLVSLDAEDGSLIDINNKARMKSTLVGAGAGAGLGAFTAYQGAQSEIEERLYTAQREYKDSLNMFYCITGNRLLSMYNEVFAIPAMQQ
ncbi:MAG: hypothetical protein IJE79_04075 [Alphaproteobacteria bacterium]|nr:hypothetical protein [Alphaproteobacteria bacterium]